MQQRSLPLATAVFSVLVLVAAASADTIERVTDGSFELNSLAWTFPAAFRCDAAVCAAPAATGTFYGSSGYGFDVVPALTFNNPIGSIKQFVEVPESPATLRFALRFVRGEGVVDTYLTVSLGGIFLTQPASEPLAFETVSIAIPEQFIGAGSTELDFSVSCSNPSYAAQECHRVDIDDVSLVTPEPGNAAAAVVAASILATLARWRRR